MPEILEVEMYRRASEPVIGRIITEVRAPDDWYLKHTDADAIRQQFVGAEIEQTGRRGKLMWLSTSAGRLGLRFGMTGRLVVDDAAVIDQLEFSSKLMKPEWNRFSLTLSLGSLVVNDPRRLGGVHVDPSLDDLGPDAWDLSVDMLGSAMASTSVPVKAALLNQKRVAGLGNLLVDELCWRSGVDPNTPASGLGASRVSSLADNLVPMLDELFQRGGSHRGDHIEARDASGTCPRDGAAMRHTRIGGRSTWWCPDHQH